MILAIAQLAPANTRMNTLPGGPEVRIGTGLAWLCLVTAGLDDGAVEGDAVLEPPP
ncbi:hypothetical protein [Streptomyces hydrogenans]|uniref:hypothetical protein n=1 Tax=Streptomyces hydrogenans TaxID=1873719 RepID=UPI0035DBF573